MEDKIFEVVLDKLAYGGEAMGRLPDGRAVFVPFALPGETVRTRLVEEKRGFARGENLEILTSSPERIEPRCSHFTVCGGCHYQHLPYESQLKAKEEILRDQLIRLGGLQDPPVQPIVASPEAWNYRNHVQFHQDEEGRLGYLGSQSHQIVPIQECHLPEPALNELWPRLQLEPLPELVRVSIRAGAEDDLLLVLESATDEAVEFEVDFPIAAVQLGPEAVHILSERQSLEMEILGKTFRVSADAFFQVNTPMAEKMVAYLLEALPLTPETVLLDVYCGVGLFSAFLAGKVGRLIGIESHEGAVQDFEVNLDEFNNVEIYQAQAEDVLPALDVQPEIIVVDPPRAGLAKEVLDAIIALGPETLAYVSCDPATLARDAKRLTAGGYALKQITPFDLFPQTYHIESISIWGKQ
jgi:23S rRNA (uracil1939-C5)-methyltransferase